MRACRWPPETMAAQAMSEFLAGYTHLAATVTRMLDLARARQWSQLPELGARCTVIVDQLRALEPHAPWPATDHAKVVALLTRIRCDQDELAALVRPQFTRLMRRIEGLQRSQRAIAAYRDHA